MLLMICASTSRAQTNTFPSTGSAGVGTTIPAYAFDVRSGEIAVTDSNGNTVTKLRGIGSSGSQRGALEMYDTNVLKTAFYSDANDSYINGGGKLGIGTTSPAGKFHTHDGTNRNLRVLSDSGNYGTSGILVQSFNDAVNANMPFVIAGDPIALMTGNVGIGTTSPTSGYKLDVRGQILQYTAYANLVVKDSGTGYAAASFFGQNGSGGILDVGVEGSSTGLVSDTAAGDGIISTRNNKKLVLGTNSTSRVTIDTYGNVGIGMTPGSGYKLDVNGDVRVSGSVSAKYQDVAEWVPSSEQLSAGTVVVLDSTKSNQVTSSSVGYDTRVAGVVSAQPGIALGEKSDTKVLVATTGRVRVKVDASKGAIHIGDLLVTSDIPGVAMKSEPVNLGGVQLHRPGTLIGKALEPLEKGKGEILVLLSLQ